MDKPKNQHGGVRAGSGRKPLPPNLKRKQYYFMANEREAKLIFDFIERKIIKPRLKKKDA